MHGHGQVGTFVDDMYDTYHKHKSRKAERQRSFQDVLLKDQPLKKYTKRKFGEIQKTKQAAGKRQRRKQQQRKRRNGHY